MRSIRLLPLLAAAVLAPASADAATTIGEMSPPGSHNGPTTCIDCTEFQISTPAGSPGFAVPAGGGVITAWSMQESPGPFGVGEQSALRVFRPAANGAYTVVGAGPAEAMRSPFATLPVRIPVQAGDRIGYRITTSGTTGTEALRPVPGAQYATVPDAAPGSTVMPHGTYAGYRLNLTAKVEPDADRDGFGDETQDACTSDASTQGACPPPPLPPVVVPPPVVPAPDRVAPKLATVRVKARQKASRGYVEVPLRSTEAATVQAASTARVAGRRGTLKLAPARTAVRAGGTVVLKVRLGKAAPALRRAVRRGKVARVTVRLTARDAAGNASSLTQAIRLTR